MLVSLACLFSSHGAFASTPCKKSEDGKVRTIIPLKDKKTLTLVSELSEVRGRGSAGGLNFKLHGIPGAAKMKPVWLSLSEVYLSQTPDEKPQIISYSKGSAATGTWYKEVLEKEGFASTVLKEVDYVENPEDEKYAKKLASEGSPLRFETCFRENGNWRWHKPSGSN